MKRAVFRRLTHKQTWGAVEALPHPKEMITQMDVIEYLSQNDKWMQGFCRECPEVDHCPADNNPFFEVGCVKESDLRLIEEAAKSFERVIEEAVA